MKVAILYLCQALEVGAKYKAGSKKVRREIDKIQRLLRAAIREGILPITAAGNEGRVSYSILDPLSDYMTSY